MKKDDKTKHSTLTKFIFELVRIPDHIGSSGSIAPFSILYWIYFCNLWLWPQVIPSYPDNKTDDAK